MSTILWSPSEKDLSHSQMALFLASINQQFQQSHSSFKDLHQWACENPSQFWEAFWNFSQINASTDPKSILESSHFLDSKWFQGATLNYAENCLHYRDKHTAIIHADENGEINRTSYSELYDKVSKCEQFLRDQDIKKGDCVAAVTTHCEEAIVLFLACSSIGATWTSCSPDFGKEAILSRFTQVNPSCLLFVDGYQYKGKNFDLSEKTEKILTALPSVKTKIRVDRAGTNSQFENTVDYSSILSQYSPQDINFEALPFDHPLYVLYSSGTTGKPKSIVHGAGGSLLEHLKEQRLHCDLRRDDTLFYYTTCSWMMWNWLVSGLASGATLLVFDGAPFYPSKESTWKLIEDYGITIYGTSAKYINASAKFKLKPKESLDLSSLRAILSTGSVLYEEDFDYVYAEVKESVQLSSISGGTDIVGCFALGNPLLPVVRGKLQSVSLGYNVQAFNEKQESVFDEKGELVCVAPFPSMPIYFHNDPGKEIYKKSYFSTYDNIWHHSDYVEISEDLSFKVLGRSDATLNRGGVRIGTAEIYRVAESLEGIVDTVVIHLEEKDRMLLFAKCKKGVTLDIKDKGVIKQTLRDELSQRHSPNQIFQVTEIPYTKNGKKVELAIKSIFMEEEEKINTSSLANADVLNEYRDIKNNFFQLA